MLYLLQNKYKIKIYRNLTIDKLRDNKHSKSMKESFYSNHSIYKHLQKKILTLYSAMDSMIEAYKYKRTGF